MQARSAVGIKPANLDPPQAVAAATAPGGAISRLQSRRLAPHADQPQPQRIVMIEHRLQAPPTR